MLLQPLTYSELGAIAAGVFAILVVAGFAASILARRRDYDGGLWGVAGAFLVGLLALAFLKSAEDAGSAEHQARRRMIGNRIAGCLIVVILLILVSVSIATNPDERDLRQFISEQLPHARDKRVAQLMTGGGAPAAEPRRESFGVYSTARVLAPGGGRIKVFGFWGRWWAAAEDR